MSSTSTVPTLHNLDPGTAQANAAAGPGRNSGVLGLPEALWALLDEQLRFQHRWQIISMGVYVSLTVGILVCTSAASLLAAFKASEAAAIVAATSTVLIGLEKSLLFREKWKFHLLMHTKLKLLQADIATQQIDAEAAAKRLSEILGSYAAELPVQAREQ